jgi:alpha-1,3-rhamnosyl/mannosyltransferase
MFDARRSVGRATGIGRVIDGLLRTLVKIDPGHQYLIITGDNNPIRGVPHERFEVRKIGLSLNSLFINTTMPALARSWHADVAYFPFWFAPLAMPCPFVVAIHDLIQVFHPEGFSFAHRSLFRAYAPLAARRARRVHALASHGKEAMHRVMGIESDRIDVISPAITPLDPGTTGAVSPPCQTHPWGRPFALYVGNHKPHKNLERLLRAFARVADQLEADLVVAGAKSSHDDPDSLPCARLVDALSLGHRVHFTGQVDDATLHCLYRDARFLVFPSLYEGFGLPALEAMNCGTPVACSNTTSLPEVVGDAAIMFDPLDESAIASALLRLDGSPELRTELSRKGAIRSKEFSWAASAKAWLASVEKAARS